MNPIGTSIVLNDAGGKISDHSTAQVLAAAISSALVGSLTVTGVSAVNGTPAAWVIPPTSVGVFSPPGSGKSWGNLSYVLSSPTADAGKVIISWVPL